MIDFNITDEELDAIKKYEEKNYEAINQMLVSDAETDIALLSSEVENKVVSILYDRIAVIEYLKCIRQIYSLILKTFYERKYKAPQKIYRGTNLSEIERIKTELFIDRMLATTESKDDAINEYSAIWNRPACMNITLDENVPFIYLKEILKDRKYKNEILVSPFTKIKFIEENTEEKIDKGLKIAKCYNVELEKQFLDELSERERNGLYQYILENAYYIKKKIVECIELEKENAVNFENIRKLEQLLSKYENEIEEKEDTGNVTAIDYDDVERINHELRELKKISTSLFEVRKDNINFINMWKRNIAVYMIAECKEVEKMFKSNVDEESGANFVAESYIPNEENEKNEKVEDESKSTETPNDTIIPNEFDEIENSDKKEDVEETTNSITRLDEDVKIISEEIIKEMQEIEKEKTELEETKIVEIIKDENLENETEKDEDKLSLQVREECEDNIKEAEKLLANIKDLITKQQNHAKIAGNIGAVYSALNNAFEMRKVSDTLLELLKNISEKAETIIKLQDCDEKEEKLKNISEKNIQISTLFNYLNNPKIAAKNSKATRFDEMAIIEENELKRGIAERIRSIRGEAELKKLKDDLEIIEDKSALSRFFGFFTGQNKLDDFMIEQIEIRQLAIRRTLAKNLSLAYNYSIHELMAEIDMFLKDNADDELVFDDVADLNALADELRKNFIVLESKVQNIVEKKEGKNQLLDNRKISKMEIIEIETYRFLNKYGYDLNGKTYTEEPKYQDTMANEIARIIEYIKSSKIL